MLFRKIYRRLENTGYKVERDATGTRTGEKTPRTELFQAKRDGYILIVPIRQKVIIPEPNQNTLFVPPPIPLKVVPVTHAVGCSTKNLFFLDRFSPALSIRFSQDALSYFRTFQKDQIMFSSCQDTRHATGKKSLQRKASQFPPSEQTPLQFKYHIFGRISCSD